MAEYAAKTTWKYLSFSGVIARFNLVSTTLVLSVCPHTPKAYIFQGSSLDTSTSVKNLGQECFLPAKLLYLLFIPFSHMTLWGHVYSSNRLVNVSKKGTTSELALYWYLPRHSVLTATINIIIVIVITIVTVIIPGNTQWAQSFCQAGGSLL